jgi:ParB family chromosome partitioning protein
VSKLNNYEKLAQECGESREQIRRYIRLTYLIKELLDMVDEGRIALRPAVELSYLTVEQQKDLFYIIFI